MAVKTEEEYVEIAREELHERGIYEDDAMWQYDIDFRVKSLRETDEALQELEDNYMADRRAEQQAFEEQQGADLDEVHAGGPAREAAPAETAPTAEAEAPAPAPEQTAAEAEAPAPEQAAAEKPTLIQFLRSLITKDKSPETYGQGFGSLEMFNAVAGALGIEAHGGEQQRNDIEWRIGQIEGGQEFNEEAFLTTIFSSDKLKGAEFEQMKALNPELFNKVQEQIQRRADQQAFDEQQGADLDEVHAGEPVGEPVGDPVGDPVAAAKKQVTETDILALEEQYFQQYQADWVGPLADFDDKKARETARRRAEYTLGVTEEKGPTAEELANNKQAFVMDYVEREFNKNHPDRPDGPWTNDEKIERAKLGQEALSQWDRDRAAEQTAAAPAQTENETAAEEETPEQLAARKEVFIDRWLRDKMDDPVASDAERAAFRKQHLAEAEAAWGQSQKEREQQQGALSQEAEDRVMDAAEATFKKKMNELMEQDPEGFRNLTPDQKKQMFHDIYMDERKNMGAQPEQQQGKKPNYKRYFGAAGMAVAGRLATAAVISAVSTAVIAGVTPGITLALATAAPLVIGGVSIAAAPLAIAAVGVGVGMLLGAAIAAGKREWKISKEYKAFKAKNPNATKAEFLESSGGRKAYYKGMAGETIMGGGFGSIGAIGGLLGGGAAVVTKLFGMYMGAKGMNKAETQAAKQSGVTNPIIRGLVKVAMIVTGAVGTMKITQGINEAMNGLNNGEHAPSEKPASTEEEISGGEKLPEDPSPAPGEQGQGGEGQEGQQGQQGQEGQQDTITPPLSANDQDIADRMNADPNLALDEKNWLYNKVTGAYVKNDAGQLIGSDDSVFDAAAMAARGEMVGENVTTVNIPEPAAELPPEVIARAHQASGFDGELSLEEAIKAGFSHKQIQALQENPNVQTSEIVGRNMFGQNIHETHDGTTAADINGDGEIDRFEAAVGDTQHYTTPVDDRQALETMIGSKGMTELGEGADTVTNHRATLDELGEMNAQEQDMLVAGQQAYAGGDHELGQELMAEAESANAAQVNLAKAIADPRGPYTAILEQVTAIKNEGSNVAVSAGDIERIAKLYDIGPEAVGRIFNLDRDGGVHGGFVGGKWAENVTNAIFQERILPLLQQEKYYDSNGPGREM